MKTIHLLLLILIFASCENNLLKLPASVNYSNTAKTFAILPFKVSSDTNNLITGVNTQNILRSPDVSQFRYQQSFLIWLLKKSGKYRSAFQDATTTNDLLKQNGILDSTRIKTKAELCTALGVDKLIFGDMHLSKPRYTEGTNILRGVAGIGSGSKSRITLEINLFDSTGNLLWKHSYEEYGGDGEDELISTILKKAARNFPYDK